MPAGESALGVESADVGAVPHLSRASPHRVPPFRTAEMRGRVFVRPFLVYAPIGKFCILIRQRKGLLTLLFKDIPVIGAREMFGSCHCHNNEGKQHG